MKKQIKYLAALALAGVAIAATPTTVEGHGFVHQPASRAFRAAHSWQPNGAHGLRNPELFRGLNWEQAMNRYGSVIHEPQSVEGTGSLANTYDSNWWNTSRRVPDGMFGSAGLRPDNPTALSPGFNFSALDHQSEAFWRETGLTDMTPGYNDFTWFFTIGHAAHEFRYYITREGWNPNAPITGDDLELIAQIDLHGRFLGTFGTQVTHSVNLPSDRAGYHVVLAVWDIGDTDAAFYNLIDINLVNENIETPERPEVTPEGGVESEEAPTFVVNPADNVTSYDRHLLQMESILGSDAGIHVGTAGRVHLRENRAQSAFNTQQEWFFRLNPATNTYTIVNVHDLHWNAYLAEGTNGELFMTRDANTANEWLIIEADNGFYQVVNATTGNMLTVDGQGSTTANGTPITTTNLLEGHTGIFWDLVEVTSRQANRFDGYTLNFRNAMSSYRRIRANNNTGAIEMAPGNTTFDQRFLLTFDETTRTYTIAPQHSSNRGTYLAIQEGTDRIVLSPEVTELAQWEVIPARNGHVRLYNPATGQFITPQDSTLRTGSGLRVQSIAHSSGTLNTQWYGPLWNINVVEAGQPTRPLPPVIESGAPEFSSLAIGTLIQAGDLVTFNGNTYRALVTFTLWTHDWSPVETSLWTRN